MEKRNMIIIAVVAVILSGAVHNGSFAVQGTKFGQGTYVVGSDVPEGYYTFEDPYSLHGRAIYQASSQGGLSISNDHVHVDSCANITIHEGGSMTYEGS